MKEQIIDKAVNILETEEEYLIAVKKLYKILKEEFKDLEFKELVSMLREDKRFKIHEVKKREAWSKEEESVMEAAGYYSGPRVMLKSRTPSKEEVAQLLQKKTQNMLDNLKKAYESRPEGMSDEEEKQLLEVMQRSKNLQDGLKKMFDSDSKE